MNCNFKSHENLRKCGQNIEGGKDIRELLLFNDTMSVVMYQDVTKYMIDFDNK